MNWHVVKYDKSSVHKNPENVNEQYLCPRVEYSHCHNFFSLSEIQFDALTASLPLGPYTFQKSFHFKSVFKKIFKR